MSNVSQQMSDVWHVQFRAQDFSAGSQFLVWALSARLPYRWLLHVLGGSYSLLFTLAIFSLWRVVEDGHIPYGRWFVAVFATTFVLGFAASAVSRRVWANGMEHLWGANASTDVVRLDSTAITIEGGMGLMRIPWALVQDIVREKEYLYLIYRGVACLYIPAAGFSEPAQFQAFEAKARELFARSRESSIEVARDAG